MRGYQGKRTTGMLPGTVVAVAALAVVALASAWISGDSIFNSRPK
ncbi:MAG: hypothetical protein U9Q07_14090 [Planctomycetota bacterium]|nr:hypothetical protein [Planctomycetota bacterium]